MSPYVVPGIKRYLMPGEKLMKSDDFDYVVDTVLQYFKLSRESVFRKTRSRRFLYPRQIVTYMLRTSTTLSLSEIGKIVGNRDHTTVLHSVKLIDDLRFSDPNVLQDILNIKQIV